MMRWLLGTLLLLTQPVVAEAPEQLIDRLTDIDCPSPGVYPYMPFGDFWAVIPERYPHEWLPGEKHEGKPDCIPDAMRELVRLGPTALPVLLRHLDDARPTKFVVGVTLDPKELSLGGQLFTTEYEPRAHVFHLNGWPSAFTACVGEGNCMASKLFFEPYPVRVGDVCYTLIGQIVNRELTAVRYQMTGFLLVNSPVERPELAERVRTDWSGIDAEGLKAALLADLREENRHTAHTDPTRGKLANVDVEREALNYVDLHARALRRLRFYFPRVYAGLTGHDLEKRIIFEQVERQP